MNYKAFRSAKLEAEAKGLLVGYPRTPTFNECFIHRFKHGSKVVLVNLDYVPVDKFIQTHAPKGGGQ